MKFLDLFAGVGGFRTGMVQNGFEPFGFVEIDKFARQSYEAMYDTKGEWTAHDITDVSDDDFRLLRGQVDIITGGFPCQSFSIAGNRGGFNDTRGTLFFDIARAAKEIQPSILFLENVKGLFSHDKGRTFGTIIQTLDELGYVTEWGLFNSKFWGVPQNRERVMIVAVRKDIYKEPILFGLMKQQEVNGVQTKLKDVLESEVDEKFYLSDEQTTRLTKEFGTNEQNVTDGYNTTKDDVSYAITTRTSQCYLNSHVRKSKATLVKEGLPIKQATKQGYTVAEEGDSVNFQYPDSETRRGRVGKQIANTIQAGETNQGVVEPKIINPLKGKTNNGWHFEQAVYDDEGITRTVKANGGSGNIPKTIENGQKFRIRKLTPNECWRLQGFTDEQFSKAQQVNSNSQLYKQAGNAVTVNVISAVASELSRLYKETRT